MEERGKTLIVGMGNLIYQDDGVGVHVIEAMKKMALPSYVELLDIGTSTMDLIPYLDGVKKLIVIDAMKAAGIPGTIYRCGPEDLLPKKEEPVSLHDIGLLETLSMAKKKGLDINVVLIGVEPKVFDWGMELSEEVKSKIPNIIEAVLKES
ncbi:MAG TPA: hydrogenase maturation protease [Thermodesulfobacteriota bacterium]|nr:hydrogenase maturation protease [Thermodesulfobacteriota bacterium]